jgi:hypothetical protein
MCHLKTKTEKRNLQIQKEVKNIPGYKRDANQTHT